LIPLLCFWVSLVQFSGPNTTSSSDVSWLNAPGAEAAVKVAPRLDPALQASGLTGGLVTAGRSRIAFRPTGEFVVEVFVIAQDPGRRSFLLEADKEVVDSNLRLRATGEPSPDAPVGYRTLIGIVHGPAELSVRSSASEYAISAIRWRSRDEYERDVVPAVVARARQLQADSNVVPNSTERQRILRQLWERAWLARDATIANEAALGMTRAFYWEAMRYPDTSHFDRLLELLQRALRRAPNDALVHQMVSAACAGTNLPPGSEPGIKDFICKDVKAVFWRSRARDRADAPTWAEAQRKLRIRLEDIAAFWIDRRQRPDGSLGSAWQEDDFGAEAAHAETAILRNLGALAAGLGSDLAARGMDRLANGLFASRLLEHGYDKQTGVAATSSRLTSGTLPYMALLRPDVTTARMRDTALCLPYWIRQQDDGAYRFSREAYNCREFAPESRYVDTWRNLEAAGPALWYAAMTHDDETVTRLWYWAEAWAKLMRSMEGGKLSGVIPEEMFSADGSYVIREGGWSPEGWSADGQRAITWLFAALYDLKDDKRWLAAAEEALTGQPPEQEAIPVPNNGADTSPDEQPGKPPVPQPLPLEKKADSPSTGGRRLLQKLSGKHPLAEFFEHTSEWDGGTQLAKMAGEFEQALSTNFAMYSTEALFPDRVFFEVPETYQRFLFGGAAPRPDRYPAFAVTWAPAREEYARAVVAANETSIQLKLFNFEPGVVQASLRAWRLRPGRYQWSIQETRQQGEVEIDGTRRMFLIPLAPGRELTVSIRRR